MASKWAKLAGEQVSAVDRNCFDRTLLGDHQGKLVGSPHSHLLRQPGGGTEHGESQCKKQGQALVR